MMKLLSLVALGLIGVTVYRRLGRESMTKQKPRSADVMSYRWRVESAYDRDGDAA